jgi:hypothetical protein
VTSLRSDETWHRLRDWTASSAQAERLAAQVLSDEGFTDIDPSHPLGGPDGGADALARRDGKRWVMAVYFPLGQQGFSEIKNKFVADSTGVERNKAEAFVFVTNQQLSRSERTTLEEAVGFPVELFHLERVAHVLDRPNMQSVRQQYLGMGPADGTLNRAQRLEELWRASLARCKARWTAIGLAPEEAQALAEDRSLGAPGPFMCPNDHQPLVVWTAPLGSGKSIASERYHQGCLEGARDDVGAPVPVFLRASECARSLAQAVETAAREVGQVRTIGARIVVDGVDEVGYQAADELLMQARVLVGTWRSTTVLMTSRAVPVLEEAPERKALPALTQDEQKRCIQLGLGAKGGDVSLYRLQAPVRATVGQPFFALLVGLWMRHRSGLPRAPIDLMAMLGDRATGHLRIDQHHLRALAVRSVSRELGPVPTGDVLEGARPDDLLATGMLEYRNGELVFVLPAVAQWFAAQALLSGEVSVGQLLTAPEDLELWLYSLALAVSLGSADQASELLAPLLAQEPGFALRILSTAFGHAVLGGSQPPPWREAGVRAREALQAIADALGPMAHLVCEVNRSGHVLPMAVATADRHFSVAFWKGEEHRDDVFLLPRDFDLLGAGPGWDRVRSGGVGPGAAWAWHWACETVRHSVDQLLAARAFPVPPDSPLGREAGWATACALTGKGVLWTGSIELAQLEQLLRQVPPERWTSGPVPLRKGNIVHDLRGLYVIVTAAKASGETELVPPVPPADVVPNGPGLVAWVGDFYSDERIAEAATVVYKLAVVAYRQIAERWMPTLLSQLEHYVLMPMRVVGFVNMRRGQPGGLAGSHLAGYLEALPLGSDNEIAITLLEGAYDFSTGDTSYAQQRAARPDAARWLSGSHGSMPLELGHPEPVADVVYNWVAQDLVRLGLAKPGTHARTGKTCVRFDLSPSGNNRYGQ